MAFFVMFSHQNLVLDVEVADIVVKIDIFADKEGSDYRIFDSCAEGPPG